MGGIGEYCGAGGCLIIPKPFLPSHLGLQDHPLPEFMELTHSLHRNLKVEITLHVSKRS